MIRRVVLAVALLALVGVLCAPNAQGQKPVPELERAKELMRQVPLIDGHNDLPWALRTDYGMDWDSLDISRPQPQLMTDIPRLRAGLVGAQFWSTYVPSSFDGSGAGRRVGRDGGRHPADPPGGEDREPPGARGWAHDRELARHAARVLP